MCLGEHHHAHSCPCLIAWLISIQEGQRVCAQQGLMVTQELIEASSEYQLPMQTSIQLHYPLRPLFVVIQRMVVLKDLPRTYLTDLGA